MLPEWEEETVSNLLRSKGEVLHAFVGVAQDDWRYTEADLKAIAGPLCRILNRYPATQAAAGAADPIALAIGASGYAIRSARERAEMVKLLREELEEEPITGAPAPDSPGAQPPPGFTGPGQPAPRPAPEPEPPAGPLPDPDATPASELDWQRA